MSNERKEIAEYLVYIKSGVLNFSINPAYVETLYYIEDIYSMSVVGKITFIDINGSLEKSEQLDSLVAIIIAFKDDENSKINYKHFISYTITSENLNKTTSTKKYTILFADPTFFLFNKKRYSISWPENTTADTIVRDLATTISKSPIGAGEIESSSYKLPCYYSPIWTVKQNIMYLMPRSKSAVHNVSGYLFYTATDIDGADTPFKFNYVTLESLLRKSGPSSDLREDAIYRFNFEPVTQESGMEHNEKKSSSVITYKVLSYDNANLDFMFGSTYFGYDMTIGKEPIRSVFGYEDVLDRLTILGNQSLFRNSVANFDDAKYDIHPSKRAYWTMEKDNEALENLFMDDWIKRYCQQQLIEVVTRGNSRRAIGKMAFLNIKEPPKDEAPGQERNTNKENSQKYYGNALIKSITHFFSAAEPMYLQKIVFIKNGYYNLPGSFFAPAKNKNIGGIR